MPLTSRIPVLLCILSLLMASGCGDDLRSRSVFDRGAGDAVISFSVESVTLSRSGDVQNVESLIDHAYILFYSSEGSDAGSAPLAAAKAVANSSIPGTLAFSMPSRLLPDTDYKILAIANADAYVPEGYDDYGSYLEHLYGVGSSGREENPIVFRQESMLSGSLPMLPMSGTVAAGMPFRFSMRDGGYQVSASLVFRRMVARIDVVNTITSGFHIDGVALCNWGNAASLDPADPDNCHGSGSICGILADESEIQGEVEFVEMHAPDENRIQRLEECIYSFPSTSYQATPGDKESTALIIKARYEDDSEPTYYRVNVNMKGNRSEIKGNTKYLVSIRSVKGRGAPTPEEAYAAKESLIVLSVVEDWDLDGAFDTDGKGNFIVLSTGSLEFDGDSEEIREVRILTSKGLTWTVEYLPNDEESTDAFKCIRLSDQAIAISPKGKNIGESLLSGIFTVEALTSDGGNLKVDVHVAQNVAAGGQEEPVIPDGMPFALVPADKERVKIDHINRKIEIDGFNPDCFNSFIDVPFEVKVFAEPDNDGCDVTLSSTIEWPLEGRIAFEKSNTYFYCKESFGAQGSVCDFKGTMTAASSLMKPTLSVADGDTVYISVGAMAPDDPAIERVLHLSSPGMGDVAYDISIKPRSVIIDDVVIRDANGNAWLIQDRNKQDTNNNKFKDYIGRNVDGTKPQAYNYSYLLNTDICIPFKFKDQAGTPFGETAHTLYEGLSGSANAVANTPKNKWLELYLSTGDYTSSPFYSPANFDQWVYPSLAVMEAVARNVRMSKLRMYLLSETAVLDKGENIPVCCYLPYHFWNNISDTSDYSRGYFYSANGTSLTGVVILYYNDNLIKTYSTTYSGYFGMARLVRPLSEEEYEMYRRDYLGYGPNPHRLRVCHPDTYGSLDWIPVDL